MPQFVGGLDPGKQQDYAALAVLEQVEGDDPLCPGRPAWTYTLAGLEQYPLGTPYATVRGEVGVGERVKARFASPPLTGSQVAVDQTGVGAAVLDLLRSLGPSCVLFGVVITGGETCRREGLSWHVSKGLLVSNFVSLLHSGRFKVPDTLRLKAEWDTQLAAFREKQRPSGSLIYEADRLQDHDDMVCAAMIAAFLGERQPPFRASDIGRGAQTRSRQAPLGTFLPPSMRPERGRW
jgi:hypothetical protein